ncbi:fibroblast growth factor receptor-like [Anneissia japonica]|uniref:fibroblast growth factor receptor-like n=1 Tax=Anneissia japonica TaxID=1529436 RepID=UPI0014258ADF|nr:fibroblast growth factor receptor-like [Anneissia japonica]XP_033114510.1 fibroblast growth factor receptor-like [Anneissia japonica]
MRCFLGSTLLLFPIFDCLSMPLNLEPKSIAYQDESLVCNYSHLTNETGLYFTGPDPPNPYVIEYGVEDAFLSCCAMNYHQIEWFLDGKIINGAPFTFRENDQVLSISGIKELSGNYKCVVSSANTTLERVVELEVEPKYSGKPLRLYNESCISQKAHIGDNVTFYCEFEISDYQICSDFVWMKNYSSTIYHLGLGDSHPRFSRYTTFVVQQESCNYGKKRTRGTHLYIYNVSEEAFGEYIIGIMREQFYSYSISLIHSKHKKDETNIINDTKNIPTYIILISFGILLLILVSIFIYFCWRRIPSPIESEEKMKPEAEHCLETDPIFKDIEILFEEQVVWDQKKLIGKGRFGNVFQCPVFDVLISNDYSNVAIKTPKEHASAAEKDDLKNEIEILMQLRNHFNIIELIACHTKKDPIMLITEILPYGSLQQFLRTSSKMQELGEFCDPVYNIDKPSTLYDMSRQIANGMSYVADMKIVHGDLAARNVLVGHDLNMKIADFGLAKDVYETGYMRLDDGEIPVKWYSIETILGNIVSSKSDIWSFGVLLYEIFSDGRSPYPGVIVHTLPEMLKKGYRMSRPVDCPVIAYNLMMKCWEEDPSSRPSFHDLYKRIDSILEDVTSQGSPYMRFENTPDGYAKMIIVPDKTYSSSVYS